MKYLALITLFALSSAQAQDQLTVEHGCGVVYSISGMYKGHKFKAVNITRNMAQPYQKFRIDQGTKQDLKQIIWSRANRDQNILFLFREKPCWKI